MTRTVTRTIKPRYVCQGNRHSYRTAPGYQRTSRLGGAFETTRSVWAIGGKPSLMLLACGIVATFAIVAIGA